MTELSITAPSRLIATDVPVALNTASRESRSVFNLVPQVLVDAPTSGLVKFKFVVNVSAIIFYFVNLDLIQSIHFSFFLLIIKPIAAIRIIISRIVGNVISSCCNCTGVR